MIPVLLLLPSPPGINRSAYIRDCVKESLNRNELPLSSDIYSWLGAWKAKSVNPEILMVAEKVVVHDDFPPAAEIESIIILAEKTGKEVERRKLTRITDIYDVLDHILFEVCSKLGIQMELMSAKTRKREVVDARFVYCRRAHESTDATWAQIGSKISRDHASAIHGEKEAKKVAEIIRKYNKCYANQTSVAYAIMSSAGGSGVRSITKSSKGSLVSYGKMEKGGETVPDREPTLQTMRETG